MNKPGILIIIEGGDGVGTTTQSKLLWHYLHHKYPQTKPVLTAEPSSGPIGQLLREILTKKKSVRISSRGMAALFYADRADHYGTVIEPAITDGSWVISDRCYQSTLVYQALAADPAQPTDVVREAQWIMQLHSGLPCVPTYSFILDVPHEVTAERRAARGGVTELFDDAAQQERVLSAYRTVPAWDWVSRVIYCGNDSVENVHNKLVQRIEDIATEMGLSPNV